MRVYRAMISDLMSIQFETRGDFNVGELVAAAALAASSRGDILRGSGPTEFVLVMTGDDEHSLSYSATRSSNFGSDPVDFRSVNGLLKGLILGDAGVDVESGDEVDNVAELGFDGEE